MYWNKWKGGSHMSNHHHECNISKKEAVERIIDRCCCEQKVCCPERPHFTREDAEQIARVLGINTASVCFDIDEFQRGLNVELEHGLVNPATNITNNDPILTGKIVWAHLNIAPDYYKRLAKMRREAREYWDKIRRKL
jgi:hypothetical protein